MAWRHSTGWVNQIAGGENENSATILADTISFASNSISDSASGLGGASVGDWVRVVLGANNNVIAQVVTATADILTVPSGTFTVASAGTDVLIEILKGGGSYSSIMMNSMLELYDGTIPTDADQSVGSGVKLAVITRDGGAFVSGAPGNGLNVAPNASNVIKRATDSSTGVAEVWTGTGLADGTARWGRWNANIVIAGVSTVAVRMDGLVSTSSTGDIIMANGRDIVTGAPVTVTDVSATFVSS